LGNETFIFQHFLFLIEVEYLNFFFRHCNSSFDLAKEKPILQAQFERALPRHFQESTLCAGTLKRRHAFPAPVGLTNRAKSSFKGYQLDGYGSCFGDSGSPVVQFETSRGKASHYVQVRSIKMSFFIGKLLDQPAEDQ
jgi:hypothetical protein